MVKPVLLRTDGKLKMGEKLQAEYDRLVKVITAEDDCEETILSLCKEASVIFTCYAPITERIITAASNLRGIVKYGVGLDSIDLGAAARQGIPVVHCPDYGTETVAEHAFALMIALSRRLHLIDREMHKEGWIWPEVDYMAEDLFQKKIGLIGLGRIGRAVARRASSFDMRILAFDPYVNPVDFSVSCLEYVDFETVISESDFISLHCILTSETEGMIDRSVFEKMKRHVLLVNTARGALIDEKELVRALRENRIGGAALDVFMVEPPPKDHPLFELPNVLMTPHFAFYSREAYDRLEKECYEAVCDLLEGKCPPNTINTEKVRQYKKG